MAGDVKGSGDFYAPAGVKLRAFGHADGHLPLRLFWASIP
jgi:hypothetical protein